MTLAETINLNVSTPIRDELADFLRQAAAGDTEAFDKVMIQTQKRVMAMTWRMLGNEADARDATQEVFLRVYKYLGRYDHKQDFHGWLYGITVNACRDLAKKRTSHTTIESADQIHDKQATAEQTSIEAQQREMVRQALASLPEKERAAVVLRDLEGFSTEEAARILRSSPTTVRSQICTARRKIKIYCERFMKNGRTGGMR
ncbi:MAG TPA: sigma-70 family RNA polymerase sigma factor [Pyrinomonadaceae bacterium]|nr:sigma-70 family RNA polymerase sigma factor [Pyrinomonadaceae bacterium]